MRSLKSLVLFKLVGERVFYFTKQPGNFGKGKHN